jgi:hypothetical protein
MLRIEATEKKPPISGTAMIVLPVTGHSTRIFFY